MTNYNPGDRVRVTFEATVAARGDGGSDFYFKSDDSFVYLKNADRDNLTAEVLPNPDPEFWPPLVGDIWKTDKGEYYVRRNTADISQVVVGLFEFRDGERNEFYEDSVDEEFKAFKPVLVRRASDFSSLAREKPWQPTSEQRMDAREELLNRMSFSSLELGKQIGAVTDLLNAWHEAGEQETITSFAYEWFRNSKYVVS